MLRSSPTAASGAERAEALQVLLDSTAMLLRTPSREDALAGILDLASKVLAADAYAVWRDSDGHGAWRAIARRGLSPAYRTEVVSENATVPAEIQAVEDVTADPTLNKFQGVYAEEGICSMMVVPLALHDGRGGTLTFYWRKPQTFSQLDKDYAAALANLSAAALNTIELRQQNDHEKQRLSFLAEASTILASSLDYETTLHRVAHLVVPQIADWCTVHIVENGVPTRLVVAHSDTNMLAFAEEFSKRYPEEIREDSGLGLMLRTGKSEVYKHITDEMLTMAARDEAHLAAIRALQITSSILVPLTSRGKVLGAIRLLAAGTGRYFNDDDVQLAEDLARRAAIAIENAQLHRAVLKQESELRLSHATARMGSWSWDLEKQEISWSPEFKALYGLPSDATPRNGGYEGVSHLIHPEDRERVQQELQEVLASRAEQIMQEHRAVTPDGRILWIHSRGSIHRDAAGKALSIAGISIDVTESRQAENALRRTEKLAAAGRLAATVAHEVNNPLEALTNLIYLAATTEGLPESARGYLETAEGELSRMAHIVRQTLGFYRESVHPRLTDLGEIAAEVVDLYRSRAEGRGVTLECATGPHMTALTNAGEIRQVLANLISNAIDASASGGTVHTSVQRAGDHVEVSVTDHGTGITEAHLGRLFEPFFTTKADVGTGLGLWVSKGIVEKHGGTIRVASSSTPGDSGTTFTVSLPLLEPSASIN